MCKGDGNKILSNVELILPWNVVEACYNLEPADSTCFFATNKEEETQSQISLFKQEDHSVKIQVTVMALTSDDADADLTDEVEGSSKVEEEAGESSTSKDKTGSVKKYSLRRSAASEKESRDTPKKGTPKKGQAPPPPAEDKEAQGDEAGEEEGTSPKGKKFRPKPRQVSTVKPTLMNKRLTAIWGGRKRKVHKHQQLLAAAKQKQQSMASKGITTRSGKSTEASKAAAEPETKSKQKEQGPSTPKGSKKEAKKSQPEEGQGDAGLSQKPKVDKTSPQKGKPTVGSPKRGYQFNEDEWTGAPIPVPEIEEPHMPVLEAVENEDDYFPPPPPAAQGEEEEIKYWEEVKRQYQKQVQLQMEELEGRRKQEEAEWDKLASAVQETQKARSMVIVIKPNDDDDEDVVMSNPNTPKPKKGTKKRKTDVDDDVIITKAAPSSGKKKKVPTATLR